MKKQLLNPHCVVTGNPNGSSLYYLLEVVGKEKVMQRIEPALINQNFSN